MPGLLIKDLPSEIHAKLKRRAKANRRSMGREALVLLETALSDRAGPPSLALIDRLRVRGGRPLTDEILEEASEDGRP